MVQVFLFIYLFLFLNVGAGVSSLSGVFRNWLREEHDQNVGLYTFWPSGGRGGGMALTFKI